MSLGLFVEKMPDKVKDGFDLAAKLIVIALGLIMFIYGWKFTMLMGQSTMPGLGVPSGVLYAAIPVTGFLDRKSTRLNSSHVAISYAVFCLKKKITAGRT